MDNSVNSSNVAKTGSNDTSVTGDLRDRAQAAADTVKSTAQPAVDKARSVIKEKPWASALAAGVFGLAILGTLRGRRAQA